MKTLIALILILNSFCLSAMADADLKLMNSARLAYEKNKLDEAIEIYSKISKNSAKGALPVGSLFLTKEFIKNCTQ